MALCSLPGVGLKREERVAVAIETSYQNTGLATAIALNMFTGTDQAAALHVALGYGGTYRRLWTSPPRVLSCFAPSLPGFVATVIVVVSDCSSNTSHSQRVPQAYPF